MMNVYCSRTLLISILFVFLATVVALEQANLPVPPRECFHHGHIPGALHLADESILNPETKCLLPDYQLKKGEWRITPFG